MTTPRAAFLRRALTAAALAAALATTAGCATTHRTPAPTTAAAAPAAAVIAPVTTPGTTPASSGNQAPTAPAAPTSAPAAHSTPPPARPTAPAPATSSPAHPAAPHPAAAPTSAPAAPIAQLPDRMFLDAAQTPLDDHYHWTWYAMLPPANPGHFGFATGLLCDAPAMDTLGATAVVPHDVEPAPQTSPDLPSIDITQRLFQFPTPAAATKAYTTLSQTLNGCADHAPATSTTPGTRQTASTADGQAWATYPTPEAPDEFNPLFERHDYLTVNGPVVSVLTVSIAGRGTPDPDYSTAADPALLTAITASLHH